jgi:branched-chain amino acid transport system permease protein
MRRLFRNIKDNLKTNKYLPFFLTGIVLVLIYILYKAGVMPVTIYGALLKTTYYFIAGLGFALLLGYGGLASLGTGGFVGIGAFAIHFFTRYAQLPLLLGIVGVFIVVILAGIMFGFVSLRISGMYLAIITMGLSQIVMEIIKNIPQYATTTTAPFGSAGIKLIGSIKIPADATMIFAAIFVVLCMIATYNLINSTTGRALLSIKNSETAAQTMGISMLKFRLLAFVISGIFASIAGVLGIMYSRTASTSQFSLSLALNILAAVVVGGTKSIWGILIGTFVIFGLDLAVFQNLSFLPDGFSMIINGVLIIIVVMFYPGGLIQIYYDIKKLILSKIKKRRIKKYGEN